MKKIVTLVCLLMITCLSYAGDFKTPQLQNRMVNDYINLLSETEKEELEAKVVEFNKTTSIEVVVVILDDLNGEEASTAATQIGQDWGIGKRGLDNGIVFLVVKYNQSVLEKLFSGGVTGDVAIATGYGLEPYITDAKAGRILDSHFIPHVEKKKFNTAIISTVDKLISELGPIGWGQREELRRQREQERREAIENFFSILGSLLGAGAIGGFFIWLFKRIKRAIERNRRRRQLRNSLNVNLEQIEQNEKLFLGRTTEKESTVKNYPNWAKENYETKVERLKKDLKNTYAKKDEILEKIQTNLLDEAERDIASLGTVNPVGKFEMFIKEIEGDIAQYKRESPEKIKSCENNLISFKSKIERLKKTGFSVDVFENSHNNLLGIFEGIRALSSKRNQEKKIVEESNQLINKINNTENKLLGIEKMKTSNDGIITGLTSYVMGIDQQHQNAESKLQELMKNPPTLWEDIKNNLAKIAQLKTNLSSKIDEAQKKNNMEIQLFEDAKTILNGASTLQNKINSHCNAPQQKLEEIAEAKTECEKLLKSIPNEISKAKRKIQEGGSDIEYSTKTELQSAESKFEEGKKLCSANPINWIIAYNVLATVLHRAKRAFDVATDNIKEAERKREEEREAERKRKRRAEEAAAAARRNSQSYSSSSRGFSGGGGTFGGGGASRRF